MLHFRISELEQAMSKMREQMIQNQDDVTVIETLRLSINNYQEAVNAERREHQTTKYENISPLNCLEMKFIVL